MKHIAIFASGTGSNAAVIMNHFANHPEVHVALVVSSKAEALVLEKARQAMVPSIVLEKKSFLHTKELLSVLESYAIDTIILAGFLWHIPSYLIQAFQNKIVNIHPSLLPKFGGKGMYGHHVHEAVLAAGELISGITIHFVNEHYDEGEIIFQANCPIDAGETPDSLATKIHALEHAHFAPTIEKLML